MTDFITNNTDQDSQVLRNVLDRDNGKEILQQIRQILGNEQEQEFVRVLSDTVKSITLGAGEQSQKVPSVDQFEHTKRFAKFLFDEQARIAAELTENNGQFTLRGKKFDINKTSGIMQLQYFLTEAQTALGAMQRMLSLLRDWEKKAVEQLN